MQAPITVDFETDPIQQRPNYPPAPVGVAIKWPREPGEYMAFRHPTGNNCDERAAKAALERVWTSGLPVLFHNAKFDLQVATEKWGFSMLPWERIHDTEFLAFLANPHAKSLGLKPLAEDLLQWPPDERDEMNDWVWEHRVMLERITGVKVKKKEFGAWIWATPGDICGKYAIGDVDRTFGLFEHLMPLIIENEMTEAYDRERKVLPIFMENERVGIRVDLPALNRDIEIYQAAFDKSEEWLRAALHASGLNFDADQDVAAVLLQQGVVPAENWSRTASGGLCVKKDILLPEHFSGTGGAEVSSVLGYRNRLKTCLTMFMRPWAEQGNARGGYISTNWNQIRNPKGGTRTGRPSTTNPNFLNISKSFEGKDDGYAHPAFMGLPELPLVRRYMLPDEGCTWLKRDFSGQELRIFAHFESGALWRAYQADPTLDVHAFVGQNIAELTGHELPRGKVKIMNFQAIYGGGVPAAQAKLRCTYAEAKQYKAFHDQALPGRKILNDEIKFVFKEGRPIRTWGGRLYFCEPPGFSKKFDRPMTYEYKGINYLIQGSAADVTKEAMIRWYYGGGGSLARFLVQVYDEINISALHGTEKQRMLELKEAMEDIDLSVKLLSDPEYGPTWGDLKKGDPE